jgi:hypothetical protein
VDADGDKITIEFSNYGVKEISFDEKEGFVVIASSIQDGQYVLSIRLKDNNSSPL